MISGVSAREGLRLECVQTSMMEDEVSSDRC